MLQWGENPRKYPQVQAGDKKDCEQASATSACTGFWWELANDSPKHDILSLFLATLASWR
ncbi:hypothetical protein [Kamptonema formosum]|uniref:hypothetical protein n=1 Tax=Kamptonema formosum TaxID=331992 RepID=UPI00034B5870|nr:hypothetical protein [Oscillatoria sp. PCC 10802]